MTELIELSELERPVRKERQDSVGAGFRPPLVSIIIPTLNERDNVREIVSRLDDALAGQAWEVVFVDDDSSDGTLEVLRDVSRSDSRVRYLHRIGRRGLASAVTEGVLSTSSPFIAVMDCDLQHDVAVLPTMLGRVQDANCDIVVASRFMATAGIGDWSKNRLFLSNVAKKLAHLVLASEITDPMSGFFIIRRGAFDLAVRDLSNQGYKILLDILLSAKPSLRVEEVPYTFRARVRGESKVEPIVVLEYFTLLFDKLFGHVIPPRFVVFSLVGGGGVLVHMAVLAAMNRGLGAVFVTAEIYAAIAAMIFNFFVNNLLTYSDRRLLGFWPIVRGLFIFCALCSIGAVANVGIASALFRQDYSWWLAGLAGVLVGAVWNYATTSIFTWRRANR
ncbi:MAG: glycosyltransferase family 2 protein [Xanthobacteraceae bacterium]